MVARSHLSSLFEKQGAMDSSAQISIKVAKLFNGNERPINFYPTIEPLLTAQSLCDTLFKVIISTLVNCLTSARTIIA